MPLIGSIGAVFVPCSMLSPRAALQSRLLRPRLIMAGSPFRFSTGGAPSTRHYMGIFPILARALYYFISTLHPPENVFLAM